MVQACPSQRIYRVFPYHALIQAWLGFSFVFYNLDSLIHAFFINGSFLPPYTREENFHLDILAAAGIEPGSPASQVRAFIHYSMAFWAKNQFNCFRCFMLFKCCPRPPFSPTKEINDTAYDYLKH